MDSNASLKVVKRARALRKAMTEPEIMIWSKLKGRGQGQPIFRRQFAYESMIFDFYCPAAKLAVEIDGATHWDDEKRGKDEARDHWLRTRGITVMRIGAGAVYHGLSDVADAVILQALALIETRG